MPVVALPYPPLFYIQSHLYKLVQFLENNNNNNNNFNFNFLLVSPVNFSFQKHTFQFATASYSFFDMPCSPCHDSPCPPCLLPTFLSPPCPPPPSTPPPPPPTSELVGPPITACPCIVLYALAAMWYAVAAWCIAD